MPGWPLWCGVGLAKSSFMEGGGLKSSIHPAGITETTKQPQMEPNSTANPSERPHQKMAAVASAQKCGARPATTLG